MILGYAPFKSKEVLMKSIKKIILELWRKPLKRYYRRKLKNHNFVILSSNCIGGCLLHDFGERFDTPTVNLIIPKFVTFVENWQDYLKYEPVRVESDKKYPVYLLNDIEIHAVHYKDDSEFLPAWKRRTERFFDRVSKGAEIIVMAVDTQLREPSAYERFHELDYKKVAFTAQKLKHHEFISIPEYSDASHVGDLTKYSGCVGKRCFQKYLNVIDFLNQEYKSDKNEEEERDVV